MKDFTNATASYVRAPAAPEGVPASEERRVGIALSGGGSHGAFTAGIVHTAFSHFLKEAEEGTGGLPKVSIISGTSTGSLVGALLTELYGRWIMKDEPEKALADLKRVYTKTKQSEVGEIPSNILSQMWNLLTKHGIMDIAPLRDLIAKYFHEKYFIAAAENVDPVVYVCIAIDMVKGQPRHFFTDAKPRHDRQTFIDAIFASCAQPVVMTPAYLGERWAVDGGVREVIPFREPMGRGCTHVLAVALNEPHIDRDKAMTKNDVDVMARIGRGISVMNDEVARDDERLARMSAYINRARDVLAARGVSKADIDAAFPTPILPPDPDLPKYDPYEDAVYNESKLRDILLFRFRQTQLPDSDHFDEKDLTYMFEMGKALAEEHLDQIREVLFAAGTIAREKPAQRAAG